MKRFGGIEISVPGSIHLRANKECQDSSSVYTSEKFGIAVVCDGHGGQKHFRSAAGSKIAASVAIKAIKELMMEDDKTFLDKKEAALIQLEKNIILKWNMEVAAHYEKNSFTDNELLPLSVNERKFVESNPETAYGTTLIAVVLTDEFCFGIKIGDGDCLIIDENGDVSNRFPEDERLQFNVTTSLCDKDAIRNFRHFWYDEKPVSGIVVSTDGVINSFISKNYYNRFCVTVLEDEKVQKGETSELAGFLKKLTEDGSGDDISISVVFNRATLGTALMRRADKIAAGKGDEPKDEASNLPEKIKKQANCIDEAISTEGFDDGSAGTPLSEGA